MSDQRHVRQPWDPRNASSPEDPSGVARQLAIAQEALEEANSRREVARQAVVDFALRAVVDGQDVEEIMRACGFKEVEDPKAPHALAALFGAVSHGTPRQRFAAWLGQELCDRIAKEPEAAQ